ncbi:MAG: N-dimethylarginine dimethylaminohydrolase [Myxococcota bacterium]|jgi:N-dimethylarginine dimethylaminohydrolase
MATGEDVSLSPARLGAGRVIDCVDALPAADAFTPRAPWESVLLGDPAHFDVTYVINPHMQGQIGQVDRSKAVSQWAALAAVYRDLGYPVHVLDPVAGLPDLVFVANPSFPAKLPDGRWVVVRSRMRSELRQSEVAVHATWYETQRHALTVPLGAGAYAFEGKGDARWHPDRELIYCGYGYRTQRPALDALAALLGAPVVALELVDPYHLDTCLSPLDATTALVVEEAFTPTGLALLRATFPNCITVPYADAMRFAANGNCPDGRHFIVHHGSVHTVARVRSAGFQVIEVDTSEFIKSGGSVFCMTMMLP